MTDTLDRTDTELTSAVRRELRWSADVAGDRVQVSVTGGTVTLGGTVDSYPEKLLAEQAVRRVHGVTAVTGQIVVASTWATADDVDIAREAGDGLWDAVDVPDSVTVTVHDRVVVLSGAVTWQHQREAAARVVRYVRGVNAVVNDIVLHPGVVAAGMRTAIVDAFLRNAELKDEDITVTTETSGLVILDGTVDSWTRVREAERVCWSAPGATAVANHLTLRP